MEGRQGGSGGGPGTARAGGKCSRHGKIRQLVIAASLLKQL